MHLNDIQSDFESIEVDKNPKEVVEQFYDFVNNVPLIHNLIKRDRKRAKDMPRDSEGKIEVNMSEPHILENMDYFRPSALHFQKYGCFTKLRPNPNPNSEYGKWLREEVRRCWHGYVRQSDGEWIPGDYYYYLNYCPIQLIKKTPDGKSIRTVDFPRVWDGQYFVQHYLYNARLHGHHASELASRGKGKSFIGASLLAKRFKLGESEAVREKVMSVVTASDKKYIWGPNQILNMFKYYIDFQSQYTQFPRHLLTDSAQMLMWESGYKDKETGVRKGTQNAVVGITTGVNQDKLNGSRGVLYLIEEAGIFNDLNSLYQMIRPSVEDGKSVYGLIFAYGTAGDEMSNFADLQELMYNPDGYNMEKNPNVWDKEGQGRKWFTFFYPSYLNRAGCMDSEGNSNVTKALLEICQDRYTVKYNSTDINAITKRISQYPITPQEAIIRTYSTIFPITELNERLGQIDNDPSFYNDTYIGNLVFNGEGKVEFAPSADTPIREFPTKDNKIMGAIEIFALPEVDSNGNIPNERYLASADPYDDDSAETMSLGSFFVLDTWTDTIVMEYTGRPMFANDFFEICRKGCLFYNAKMMYENNKKGIFSYFSMMNSTYLLALTPEYLKDKQLIKDIGYGNKACGIAATVPIKNFGFQKIRDWLLQPYTKIEKGPEGQDVEIQQPNLYRLKNRALIKELILYNPNVNVDRIMSLVQLMLYREEKMILCGGNMSSLGQQHGSDLAEDPFFTRNYNLGIGSKFRNLI